MSLKNFKCYCEEKVYTKFLPGLRRPYDVATVAEQVRNAVVGKDPRVLYFGFNPVNYKGEIVVLTDSGYVFIPLNGSIELVGGAWSYYVFLRLYYAQEWLSDFLMKLGKELNVLVEDRCLYGFFLNSKIFYEEDLKNMPQEDVDFCLNLQNAFREKYREQLYEMINFKRWTDYHNHGFSFRYLPYIEIEKAINAIYEHRSILEENNHWQEARSIIGKLNELERFDPILACSEKTEAEKK